MEPHDQHTPPPPPPPSPSETSSGLDPNVAGALSYLLGPITGIIFLVIEKKNSFVRFHAAQSVGLFVAFFIFAVVLSVASTVLAAIPVLGWIVAILLGLFSLLLGLVGLFLWLFLMYKAYNGEEWEFPWVGAQSRKVILKS
ncbi:MAG: DUF4870 domain-containing protein [Gemmatimonadota bacterium]